MHQNPDVAESLLKRIMQSARERKDMAGIKKLANQRAKKANLHNKKLRDCKVHLNDDKADEEKRLNSTIFITEGDSASGSISESDVLLASASKAIIVGFSTTAQLGVDRVADREGVEIRHYRIIYHLVEDIEKALEGILEATYREITQGHLEIRAVFSSGRKSKIAGCRVLDGRINRNSLARVVRDNQVLYDGPIASLRHFKEEVSEMTAGYECGVSIANFMDFEEGDTLEIYRREKGRA